MANRFFFKRILWLSMAFGLIALLLSLFPFFKELREFTWFSLLFFMISTVLIYSISLAGLKRKKTFLYYYMGSLLLRFILSLAVIVGYYFYAKPEGIYFVIPFFFIYMGFTLVETVSLMRLAKSNA